MKRIAGILLILMFTLLVSDLYAQCPMCKTSLEEARKSGTSVGNSLNAGILYLLALPYTIASVFGFIWWKNKKSGKTQQSI